MSFRHSGGTKRAREGAERERRRLTELERRRQAAQHRAVDFNPATQPKEKPHA